MKVRKRLRKISRLLYRRRTNIVAFFIGAIVAVIAYGGLMMLDASEHVPMRYTETAADSLWLPDSVKQYRKTIASVAKSYNIDKNFVAIIMTLESGGYSKADSGQANGLMQITPYTAKDIASKHLKKPRTSYDLRDTRTNIEFGVAYLAYLRDMFCDEKSDPSWNGCAELIAAGYNGGPGAANTVFKGEGLRDMQTVIYSRNARSMWRERAAKSSPTFDRWKEAGGQRLIDAAKKEMAS